MGIYQFRTAPVQMLPRYGDRLGGIGMKLRAKTDDAQPGIVAALRKAGAKVQSLHRVGQGCPDLLVGYRGVWYVCEVKTDKGKLNLDQQAWIDAYKPTPVHILRTPEHALQMIGATRAQPPV